MNSAGILYPQKCGSVAEVLQDLSDPESPYHLVLIHGIADASDIWQEVCEKLPTRFKSYQEMSLPWNCGVGDPISYSPTPEEVLINVWKQLPSGPKVVLAHSFGANCLLAMAQTEEITDVSALVMLSVYSKPDFSAFTWELFTRYVNEFDKFLKMSINARPGSERVSEDSKQLIVEKTKEMYNPPSWVQFFILFSTTPGLDLSKFSMPTLVIAGRGDFSIEHDDIKSLADRLPNADFHCIEQCGHFAMIEDPTLTANIIQDFFIKRKLVCPL